MYPVSAAFLAAVKKNNRKYYWTGQLITAAGVTHDFGPNDMLKGSGYVSGQCCDSSEIELGSVYSTEVGLSLLRNNNYNRYTIKGGEIFLVYHLRISTSTDPSELDPNYDQDVEDDGIYEAIPIGYFDIQEANWKTKSIEIKAYDRMLRFEKPFSASDSAGLAYNFIDLCCRACDVQMEQSEQWYFSLPNGSTPLSLYSENDIETYRDVLYYIGQTLGGYFVINRAGKLELRKYGTTPVLVVEQKHRFTSSFSDFVTKYTAVSSTNVRTQEAEYYAVTPDDGLTMNLGINPFLQFGVRETREQLCTNILTDLTVINYVPFESDTIGNPALDLGDIIQFTGGQADETQISAITSNNIRINGKQTIKGVGKNPLLAQAKSKNDKNISGLINSIEKGRITVHTFTNAAAYTVYSTDMKIISIQFATSEVNTAQFFGQVIVDVHANQESKTASATGSVTIPAVNVDDIPEQGSEPSVIGKTEAQTLTVTLPVTWTEDGHADVIFTFELNDVVVELHHPQENWHSGRHTILLYWPLENVIADYTNIFNVYMRVVGGYAAIDVGNCIGSVAGQSMGASAAWDGTLEFTDTFQKFVFGRNTPGRLRTRALQDSVTIRDNYEIVKKTFSDTITERYGFAAFSEPIDLPGSNASFNCPYLDEVYSGEDEYV